MGHRHSKSKSSGSPPPSSSSSSSGNVVHHVQPSGERRGSSGTGSAPVGSSSTGGGSRSAASSQQNGRILGRPMENVRGTYEFGRELGRGQFGVTYLVTHKETKKLFACKSIPTRRLVHRDDIEDVRREVQIMHHLSGHRNIVDLKGAYEDRHSVNLVMELCEGGELFDRIIAKGHYTERAAADLCRQMVMVVHSCHSMGVMHRDLKPENFLFLSKDESSPLKATDFGLSVFFKPGDKFKDLVGSAYYVAPEVLKRNYGPEADIWSAGVILYILISGVPPFWGENETGIFDAILKGELDFSADPWPSVSSGAKDLVRKMLKYDPKDRLTASEVLNHPWIKEDGCLLVKNLVTESLHKILIDRDVPGAAEYVKNTISDLLMNRIDLSLLVITKGLTKTGDDYEVKSAHGELAERMRKRDAATAPNVGDRVPYVIIKAAKGAKAYERSEDPIYVLQNNIPIDPNYYLENQISKPLLRIFEPVLKNASSELLRGDHTRSISISTPSNSGIMRFAKKQLSCVGCKVPISTGTLCARCKGREAELYCKNVSQVSDLEELFGRLWTQCQECQGSLHQDVLCTSRDCPIFYRRMKAQKDMATAKQQLDRWSF